MIDLVIPDDGESEFNSEMDPPQRESRKMLNAIISTVEKRFNITSSLIYSTSVQSLAVSTSHVNTSHVGKLAHGFA